VSLAPVPTAAPAIAALLPAQPADPSPRPTAPATPNLVGPVARIHEGGVVFAKDNPFGFPSSIGVGGPSLAGGQYALLAAGAPTPAWLLRLDVLPYFAVRALVDGILTAAAAAQLEVGRDYVFEDHDKPGKFLTLRVEVKPDHALLSIWRGQVADPSRQLVSIRWTDASHGSAVFHTLPDDGDAKRTYLATSFDRAGGAASVDFLVDDPHGSDNGGPQQTANHLELRAYPGATAGQPAYGVRSGMTIHKAGDPATPSTVAVAANWLPDGRGAFWVAVGNQTTQGKQVFWPVDPADFGKSPPGPHDFYVDKLGLDLPRLLAGPLLKGVLPADTELPAGYPADPGAGDPFGAPGFAFGS
jgi:hypothetical protein